MIVNKFWEKIEKQVLKRLEEQGFTIVPSKKIKTSAKALATARAKVKELREYKDNNKFKNKAFSATKKEAVINLIKKLKPYNTNHSLIRLGLETDGGYLVSDDLDGIEACFSPGVGTKFAFEIDCAKKGMKIFLADKSIDKPIGLPRDFHFIQKYIGSISNEDMITLDEWVANSPVSPNTDLLLQMDIEGAEYFSIINLSDKLMRRFRIIIVEFHELYFMWDPHFFKLAQAVFNKLLQYHTCVHIHPNNNGDIKSMEGVEIPKLMEFTFLRNDRITDKTLNTTFPHPLDSDNVSIKPPLALPEIWYR